LPELLETARRFDLRQTIPTTLFAGGSRDGAPVLPLSVTPIFVELDDTAHGGDRNNSSDTELGRFLDDVVHLVAASEALNQGYSQGRLSLGRRVRAESKRDFFFGDIRDLSRVFTAATVEHRQCVTCSHAQDATHVRRCLLG
jgi:hypothetical protein